MQKIMLLLCLFFSFANAKSEPPNTYSPDGHMYVGTDYYPEHWPRQRWETDAQLMQDAGFNVVRLAEFSWILLEPEEGRFEFDWLDDAIDVLHKHNIKVILGTPTAVMPAWCAQKYPETLAMKKDGTRILWGGRKNNCFSDDTYRELSKKITAAMAEHYKDHPAVIGWQTDNEFGGTDCRCDQCLHTWQQWLHDKYKTVDELNRAWGMHFWGLQVSRWNEIPIPDEREGEWAISNPSASLDWMRFTTWLNVRFQADQVEIIRNISPPKHFITHNLMGLFQNMDYYELGKDLDFVSWDNYPTFGDTEKLTLHTSSSLAADVMRGIKGQNFWIMEQTAGPHGWGAFGRNVRPGELRQICFQQLAHGADAQIWFRWRTCTVGREQYWHGLLGHDGKAGRRYREAAQVATDYRVLENELMGTTVKTEIGIIYDYDCLWATRIQPSFPGNNYTENIQRYYNALFRAGLNCDILPPSADFFGYKIIFAPGLYILPQSLVDRLKAFVKEGGILITDCRSGAKDETSLMYEQTLPGSLSDMLGIEINEYEAVPSQITYPVSGILGNFHGRLYSDWITATSAKTLLSYTDPWHVQNYAAVTQSAYGKGQGWYIGTVMQEAEFYDRLVAEVCEAANVHAPLTPPAGVEVSVRAGNGKELLFLINHTEEEKMIDVPDGELLIGTRDGSSVKLERYGVAVIKLK